MPGLQLLAQQHQVAGQPVAAIGADFKLVGPHYSCLTAAVAREPDTAAGDGFIKQLQIPALGQITPCVDCLFPAGDAVEPEPGDKQHENNE